MPPFFSASRVSRTQSVNSLRPRIGRGLYLAFGTPFGQFASMVTFGLLYSSAFLMRPNDDEDEDEEEEDPSLEEVVKRVSPYLHSKFYDAQDVDVLDDDDDNDENWK